MSYQKFALEQFEKDTNLQKIINGFRENKWKNILVFSDDDPDGVVSALQFKKYFEKKGINYKIFLPASFELEEFRVKEAAKDKNYDLLMILDKGTCGYYNDFTKIIPDVMIIDHHIFQGNPDKCILLNPNKNCYSGSCTSHLVNMILELLNENDDFLKLTTLFGLRSDWSIRPLLGYIPEYVKPYYNEVKDKFSNLLNPIISRPTWMEIDQREKTLILNQIAELLFATTGGGFQYFYNDKEEALKDINQPVFTMDSLLNNEKNILNSINKVESLQDFINLLDEKEIYNKLFKYFLAEWDNVSNLMDKTPKLAQIGEVGIYVYFGHKTKLMPMVGSIKLGDLQKKFNEKKVALIMVNHDAAEWTHFSMRGTSTDVHLGKICSELAKIINLDYNHKDDITGGGHPQASELKIRRPEINMLTNVTYLINYLNNMQNIAKAFENGEKVDKENANKLGLDYI